MQQFEKDGVELRNAIERIERQLASPAYIEGLRDQEFWFDNLVENGTFDLSTTGWAGASASLSVASGKLRVTNGGASQGSAYQDFQTVAGQTYTARVTPTLVTATRAMIFAYGTSGTPTLASNTDIADGVEAVLPFTADSNSSRIRLYNYDAVSGLHTDFENASVYPTDGTNIIHRMPNGWKPRRVFVDGLLLREGATHDYEIKQDPEGYYIVPAVPPGANTETCILGVRT